MRKIFAMCLFTALLLSGCGQKQTSAPAESKQQQLSPAATNGFQASATPEKTTEKPVENPQRNSSQETKDDTLVQEPSSPFDWVRDANGNAKGVSVILNKSGFTPKGNVYLDMRIKNMTDRVITLHRNKFMLKNTDGQILDAYLEDSFTSGEVKLAPKGHIDSFKVTFKVQMDKIDSIALVDSSDQPLGFMELDDNSKREDAVPVNTNGDGAVPIGGGVKADNFLYDELVRNYEDLLIGAINTGKFSMVESMLLKGSSLYDSQQKLVESLSQNGTTEELVEYEIKETRTDEKNKTVFLTVREVIKVKKKDGESTNEYTWIYTVKQNEQGRFQFSDIRKP
jgi:hypothetical protein